MHTLTVKAADVKPGDHVNIGGTHPLIVGHVTPANLTNRVTIHGRVKDAWVARSVIAWHEVTVTRG